MVNDIHEREIKRLQARVADLENRLATLPLAENPGGPVVASYVGNNTDVMAHILRIYFRKPSRIADVTYGKGSFWRRQVAERVVQVVQIHESRTVAVVTGRHVVYASDLATGTDARNLPYNDGQLDAVINDFPYAGTGGTGQNKKKDGTPTKAAGFGTISGYGNQVLGSRSTDVIMTLYYEGLVEATRVIRTGGLIVVKIMDQVCAGKLRLLHNDMINRLETKGWLMEQIFYVTSERAPLMRHQYQYHARQNVSHFLVARKTKETTP